MKLIIYGNSDFAELMYYYFTNDSQYEVVGFCVDRDFIKSDKLLDKPLVAFEEVEKIFPPDEYKMFVAVGYKNMRLRVKLYSKSVDKGYKHINYISSKAIVDESNIIGKNNAILYGVVLEPFAKIGNNNIINTNTIVCHHAEIMNGCFIAAKSLVGGFTVIKNNCFIGFSSTILQKLIIEDETLVAACSLVNKNSSKFDFLVGTPAKTISNHKENGIQIKG
jgi:UDP-N-acetylbacillosamine N-acetyltransferase